MQASEFGSDALRCGTDAQAQLMSGWQMTADTCEGDDYRSMRVQCVDPVTDYASAGCLTSYTAPQTSFPQDKLEYFDQHPVVCAAGKALKHWEVEKVSSIVGKAYYTSSLSQLYDFSSTCSSIFEF